MLLNEVWNAQVHDYVRRGYQNLNNDNSTPTLAGLRKSRLTLAQIKHLRKWTDARNADHRHKMAQLRKQYRYIPPKGL